MRNWLKWFFNNPTADIAPKGKNLTYTTNCIPSPCNEVFLYPKFVEQEVVEEISIDPVEEVIEVPEVETIGFYPGYPVVEVVSDLWEESKYTSWMDNYKRGYRFRLVQRTTTTKMSSRGNTVVCSTDAEIEKYSPYAYC